MKVNQLSTYIITTLAFGMLAVYRTIAPGRILNTSFIESLSTNEIIFAASQIITTLTRPTTFIIILLVGALLAYETHHTYAWLHAACTLLVIIGISILLKVILQVPRPSSQLTPAVSYSYPSAHAAAAMGLYSLTRYHTSKLSYRTAVIVESFAFITLLLIVVSRVTLRVHTVSDIIGGILLGYAIGQLGVSWWKNHLKPE